MFCSYRKCPKAYKLLIFKKEKKKVKFILSWNVPNNYNYWNECKNDDGTHKTWKNYYATVFENSAQTAVYSLQNWDNLYNRTLKFKNTLLDKIEPAKDINKPDKSKGG